MPRVKAQSMTVSGLVMEMIASCNEIALKCSWSVLVKKIIIDGAIILLKLYLPTETCNWVIP